MDSKALAENKFQAQQKVPRDALRRFADDLKQTTNPEIVRFREINQNRVENFVRTPYDEAEKLRSSFLPTKVKNKPPFISGTYNYDNILNKEYKPLHLDAPELQRSLGPRSRFGDGDGSFWDKWVIAEVPTKGLGLDQHGIPVSRRPPEPISGFKRCYHSKNDTTPALNTIVKSYKTRRELRLTKKQEDEDIKQGIIPKPEPLQWTGVGLQGAAWEELDGVVGAFNNTDLDVLPDHVVSLPPITPLEKEKYFGHKARAGFFDVFRQLSRYSDRPHMFRGALSDGENQAMPSQTSPINRTLSKDGTQSKNSKAKKGSSKGSRFTSDTTSGDSMAEGEGVKSRGADRGHSNTTATTSKTSNPTNSSAIIASRRFSSGLLTADALLESNLKSALDGETACLTDHLAPSDQPGIYPRPLSARSKFIFGCLETDLAPRPSLIIRKETTSILNLEHNYMGDTAAVLLAKSLDGLPHVSEINIADNKLTDVGLSAIVAALHKCPHLTSLDISENKLDGNAAYSLSQYLSSPNCQLVNLVLRKSDVDDNEIGSFVDAIAKSKTLIHVDLSGNLLGSNQSRNPLQPSLTVGGKVLGDMLADSSCKIQSLKLAWNMIRLDSAVCFMHSLKENCSLVYLDISYNGIGKEGAEMLGESLHSSKTLEAINLSNNNIPARGCFAIVAGVRASRGITYVNISNNPIGELGTRAVVMLIVDEGDRMHVDLRGCSVKLKDDLHRFNYLKPEGCEGGSEGVSKKYSLNLGIPFDRAIAFEILRITSISKDNLLLENVKHADSKVDSRGPQPVSIIFRKTFDHNNYQSSLLPSENLISLINSFKTKRSQGVIKNIINRFYDKQSPVIRKIDATKIDALFNAIDLGYETWLKKMLFLMYNIDDSGLIEESELLEFTHLRIDEYMREWEEVVVNSTGLYFCMNSGIKYELPDSGTFECSISRPIVKQQAIALLPGSVLLTSKTLDTIFSSFKLADNASIMIDYILGNCQVRYAEAKRLYVVMNKESGDPILTLKKIIPRMSTVTDTRLLVIYALKCDFKSKLLLKKSMGPNLYRVSLGLYTGFYSLNLKVANDHCSLEMLFNVSLYAKKLRTEMDLGDTSQDGSGSGFRNCFLNGQPIQINEEFVKKLPQKGKLEFDYVSYVNYSINRREQSISCDKFLSIMNKLELSDAPIRSKDDFDRIIENSAYGKSFEDVSYSQCDLIYRFQRWCEENIAHRETILFPKELIPLHLLPQVVNRRASTAERLTSLTPSRVRSSSAGEGEENASTVNVGDQPPSPTSMLPPTEIAVEEKKVKRLLSYEEIIEAIGFHPLSCEQLGYVLYWMDVNIKQFRGDISTFDMNRKPFTSPRVEVIVSVFNNITNLENFSFIKSMLDEFEYGLLMLRLGILNMWCPLRPDGYYCFQTSHRESRQIIRMLIALTMSGSEEQWYHESYRRNDGPDDEGANLNKVTKFPSTWQREEHFPASGCVCFQFRSLDTAKLEKNRFIISSINSCLLALVLAPSPAIDTSKRSNAPTLRRVNLTVNEQMGLHLNFS